MKSLLQILIEAIQGPSLQDQLEKYIATKNPKNEADIEFYEKEFYRTQQSFCSFDRYY